MSATVSQFEAIKERQQRVWASGDYAQVAARIHPISERLCEAADLIAGSRVLDVASGSGNAAIAAARCGCEIIGIDYVPALLERARARAQAEGLSVEFIEADAEALPFADGSFDAVLWVVGVMFAPDHERAASELLRVCRPAGTIALASWNREGFIGELLRLVGRYAPSGRCAAAGALGRTHPRARADRRRDRADRDARAGVHVPAPFSRRASPTSSSPTTGLPGRRPPHWIRSNAPRSARTSPASPRPRAGCPPVARSRSTPPTSRRSRCAHHDASSCCQLQPLFNGTATGRHA